MKLSGKKRPPEEVARSRRIVFLLIRFAGASPANLSHPAEPSQRRPLILSVSSEAPAATPASVETAVCFAEPGTAFVAATD